VKKLGERVQGDGLRYTPPLTVRVGEACRLTGIGRSKLYELMAAGEIEIIKVGRITLLPLTALEQFLEKRRNG
jgi:excisionase family DNA binding protein